jgi:N-methylhydantoinase A
VVPNYAGNFSAWGLLEQDVVRSAALTILSRLDEQGVAAAEQALARLFTQLEERTDKRVAGTLGHEAELDLRYPGQEYTLTVPVRLREERILEQPDEIACRFGEAYERNYGHSFDVAVEIVSVRAIERTALPRPSERPPAPSVNGASRTRRIAQAFSFAGGGSRDFDVIDRESLAPGTAFEGPAIVMEATTTSYVDAGMRGVVHDSGALILTDKQVA